MSGGACARAVRGLYAVTPDTENTAWLLEKVEAAISGGACILQYRNKTASPQRRLEQATALQDLCKSCGVPLIVNDHVEIARQIDAAGVHIGKEDGELAEARSALGPHKLIGVSCYSRIELAQAAVRAGADYVAFGSFFVSTVKPGAVKSTPELLTRARHELHVPIVAIGGITAENASTLIQAGADAVAVITALFQAPDAQAEARRFTQLFGSER